MNKFILFSDKCVGHIVLPRKVLNTYLEPLKENRFTSFSVDILMRHIPCGMGQVIEVVKF